MSKYIELYPLSLIKGDGLIAQLTNIKDIPWAGANAPILEKTFAFSHGQKRVSSSLEALSEHDRAEVIAAMFKERWQKLWDAYKAEYNITDAYIVRETGTETREISETENNKYGHTITEDGSDSGSRTNSGTDAGTVSYLGSDSGTVDKTVTEKVDAEVSESDTGTVTTIGAGTDNTEDSVYGFNSIIPSPSDKSTSDNTNNSQETRDLGKSRNENRNLEKSDGEVRDLSSSETETRDLTKTNTETRESENNRNTVHGGTDTKTNNNKENVTHELNKSGNIGYVTPQRLIKEEIELWGVPYFKAVFNDIVHFMMCQIYS